MINACSTSPTGSVPSLARYPNWYKLRSGLDEPIIVSLSQTEQFRGAPIVEGVLDNHIAVVIVRLSSASATAIAADRCP